MVSSVILSFFVSSSTAILNRVERKYYFWCGICGALTYLVYYLFNRHLTVPLASLMACIILSILSQILSNRCNRPSLIFTISGIMPIVPGSLLFKSFNALAVKEYSDVINYATQALLVGVSIALGFFINESLDMIVLDIKNKNSMNLFKKK